MDRPHRPWTFRRILAVGVIFYAVGCGILVAAAFFWVSSIRENRRRTEKTPVRAQARRTVPPTAPRREPVRAANPLELESDASAFPNSPPAIPGESAHVRQTAPDIVQKTLRRVGDGGERSHPGDDLFKDIVIPRLQIEISTAGTVALRVSPRTYVRATIREDDIVYTNVAIRLKGGPGSYQQVNETPSFTVNFDKFANGQAFHGLKKLHLNSSVQDRSFLSEKISRELFEASGVPTPRAGHAMVIFNGRKMGVYVLVEGINKQFLRRYFNDVTGNVYDGHSGSDVGDNLPTNAGDQPTDKKRLKDLAVAARQPVGSRLASLEATLDLDRFFSFMAMETILWHWDGYTMHPNNFRIYHDRDTDRMVFLPQGLDQILSKPTGPLVPPLAGLVARAVLEVPELRHRYDERIAQLVTNVFRVETVTRRIDEMAKKVSERLAEIDPSAATRFRSGANNLSSRVRQRAASLQRQIHPENVLKLAAFETMALTDWQPKTDLGEASLAQTQDGAGQPVLHIATTNGCTASWRTHVLLDRGKYRFEARLKTKGVVLNPNDPRAGAGLRVSRHRVGQKNTGDRDWMPATFDLEVREDQSEVELVCELRAERGDLWFDLKSLRISRR